MSVNTIERIFWEFGDDQACVERYRADPDAYLASYDLEPAEREMIKTMDVKGVVDLGVSPLLTLMIWPTMEGTQEMPFDYLIRMNGGKFPGMGMPTWQQWGLRGFLAGRRILRKLKGMFGAGVSEPRYGA